MNINQEKTDQVAQQWKVNTYYDRAESDDWLDAFWSPRGKFRPLFDNLDIRTVVELACGHGRHTARILNDPELRGKVEDLYLMDVNEENITWCAKRFSNIASAHPIVNNGHDFYPLEKDSIRAIFCYDAMVHFEYDAVIVYLEDAFRLLVPGGRALFHHSNYDKSPGTNNISNPHWRNFMSKNLFAHAAVRSGFRILHQSLLDWDGTRNLDCISLIERPCGPGKVNWVESPQRRSSEHIMWKVRKSLGI